MGNTNQIWINQIEQTVTFWQHEVHQIGRIRDSESLMLICYTNKVEQNQVMALNKFQVFLFDPSR